MRMILALIGLVIFSLNAKADEFFPHDIWKREYGHFLAGIFGGHAVREKELHIQIQSGGFPDLQSAEYFNDLSENGLFWGGLIGYQKVYDLRLIAGVEFDIANYSNLNHTHTIAFSDAQGLYGTFAEVSYEQDWLVDLTGRVGYALSETCIPFVRFGVEVSRDKSRIVFTENSLGFPQITLEDRRWVYRFLTGLGIEVPIPCRNVSIRFEYLFHSKGKTIETDAIYLDGIVNPIYYAEQQPYTHSGRLSFVWNFTHNRIGVWKI
jgi:opacity protein-like surface antigen